MDGEMRQCRVRDTSTIDLHAFSHALQAYHRDRAHAPAAGHTSQIASPTFIHVGLYQAPHVATPRPAPALTVAHARTRTTRRWVPLGDCHLRESCLGGCHLGESCRLGDRHLARVAISERRRSGRHRRLRLPLLGSDVLHEPRRVAAILHAREQDALEHLEGHGRVWEGTEGQCEGIGGRRRSWEVIEVHGRPFMGGYERSWEVMGGHGRSCEVMGGGFAGGAVREQALTWKETLPEASACVSIVLISASGIWPSRACAQEGREGRRL